MMQQQQSRKKHPMRMRDLLRNKSIGSKKILPKRIYAATKKIFKAENVLVTIIQRVNRKISFTFF
jgi:hypothetical protein